MKARPADIVAIGSASRPTHFTPARLTAVNRTTMPIAMALMEMPGRYHWWMAAAESSAVSPHVGTQPHQ